MFACRSLSDAGMGVLVIVLCWESNGNRRRDQENDSVSTVMVPGVHSCHVELATSHNSYYS
eukprot:1596707-Rhodomonas_salina.1